MSTRHTKTNLRSLAFAPVLATVTLLGPAACSSPTRAAPRPASPAIGSSTGTGRSAEAGKVCRSALPPQAGDTLRLIARGGPFPYRQDGQVFQNREHALPRQPAGYYHEYTVKTPGSPTRGARRIVTAQSGTAYYTADHYVTFRAIDLGC